MDETQEIDHHNRILFAIISELSINIIKKSRRAKVKQT